MLGAGIRPQSPPRPQKFLPTVGCWALMHFYGPGYDWKVYFISLQSVCVCVYMCVCVWVAQSCPTLQSHGLKPSRLLCPWGFSRQEYWSGLPCPPPGDILNAEIEPGSPVLQADSLPCEPPGKPPLNPSPFPAWALWRAYLTLCPLVLQNEALRRPQCL